MMKTEKITRFAAFDLSLEEKGLRLEAMHKGCLAFCMEILLCGRDCRSRLRRFRSEAEECSESGTSESPVFAMRNKVEQGKKPPLLLLLLLLTDK